MKEFIKKLMNILRLESLDHSKFQIKKYRYIYAGGPNNVYLDPKGDTIFYCQDLIYQISVKNKEGLANYSPDYDPKLDYLIFDKSDIKGIRDIVVT